MESVGFLGLYRVGARNDGSAPVYCNSMSVPCLARNTGKQTVSRSLYAHDVNVKKCLFNATSSFLVWNRVALVCATGERSFKGSGAWSYPMMEDGPEQVLLVACMTADKS
ncbi:unnamed protein product [Sphenostylis stenocarpa]|uniref:Uncharacterized protein n=1 Tax=Sphenostylis stenocarpa TaxID=92480 RepID=A0AA86VL30_9FABA|nr:unnamed protein product [Sphenostylis stenocarpa]